MKIIIFLALKIVELLLIILVPYWTGVLANKLFKYGETTTWNFWICGLAHLCMATMITVVIVMLIWANWQLALKILNWLA